MKMQIKEFAEFTGVSVCTLHCYFSLKSIGEILSSSNYDKNKALGEQKKLLTLKKERLER